MLINKTVIPGIIGESWFVERVPSLAALKMFYYVQSGGHFFCNQEYIKKRKGYDSVLLLYTLKGSGFLEYKGRRYSITPGTGFIVDCNESQVYGFNKESESKCWEFIFVHFNGSESKKYVSAILNAYSPVFHTEQNSCISTCIMSLLDLLRSQDIKTDVIGSSLLVQILTELYIKSCTANEGESVLPDIVKDLLYTIERNYSEKLSLDQLAIQLCISKFHMLRQFRKHTGYTIYEYIQKYRLNQAKVLLRDTDIPIEEIAHKVGIDDCSHFCRLFKSAEKITPTGFRKNWR